MREDLINGAVSFLSDPQVAASSLEKRIAFLQSKNLTAEEVSAALQRTGVDPSTIPGFDGGPGGYGPPAVQRMPVQNYGTYAGGGGYFPGQTQQGGLQRGQQAEQLGRDWRDYFITATVASTVSYGLYFLAKRYIYPIISPPTPEALTSDKAAIDTAFTDAFALLDSLKSDTEALKTAEETRNTRVDQALEEVERVVESLKEAAKRREEESKRVNDEVRSLKDLIPKALEGQKESQAASLKDLQSELKSLKALLVNRAGSGGAGRFTNAPPAAQPAIYQSPVAQVQPAAQAPVADTNGTGAGGQQLGSKPFGSITGGRSAIPAWQLAAQAKAAAANTAAQAAAAQTPAAGATPAGAETNGAAAASGTADKAT